MTDNDIIKALEAEIHLADYVDSDYCDNVSKTLVKNALNLIYKQRAENAVLHRKLTDAYLMIEKLRGDSF